VVILVTSADRAGKIDGVTMTLRIDDLVPDVDLLDHDGRPWRLSEHRGRPVVLILHRHLA
jgi:hypothetical protein